MKRIFVVYNITKNGKHFAFADAIRTGENLLYHAKKNGADVMHLCKTRIEAERIAKKWNESYKQNKTYLYE